MSEIVIGSRGSDLALWQAHHVKDRLTALGHNVTINIIKTQGDKIQHLSFDKLEGKGFFTKEIEAALLDGSVDLAVHSHKDLETNPPEELIIGAVSERANPADLLLIRKSSTDNTQKWNLKVGATVGTSSARRKSQMLAYRSDVILKDLRGNVPTRINKLREEQYDAILLAKAGVDRLELDLSEFEVVVLDPTEFVPAPAQGVLGLQIRKSDSRMAEILQHLNNKNVQQRIALERKVLNLMEGGCQLPLGVYCDEQNTLFASFSSTAEGKRIYKTYEVSEDVDVLSMASQVVNELQQHVAAE
jgi:hydroxymethylbilane synthase